jgi:WbqC-like protein family
VPNNCPAGKTIAIVQSCYIPWKGYFDLINGVDEFILYDDRQFTRRDWRNRNRIKTPNGVIWLTIPVQVKGRYHQRIDETVVSDPAWSQGHWKTLTQAYAPAPAFDTYGVRFKRVYEELEDEPRLSVINRRLIEEVCSVLGISTKLSWSTDYDVEGSRTERLVNLCRRTGATRYLSGPRARDYIDEQLFRQAGIKLSYADYEGYPPYPQLHPPFAHGVTILDLIFNTGPDARRYMKSFG